jgi:hypothetical protein
MPLRTHSVLLLILCLGLLPFRALAHDGGVAMEAEDGGPPDLEATPDGGVAQEDAGNVTDAGTKNDDAGIQVPAPPPVSEEEERRQLEAELAAELGAADEEAGDHDADHGSHDDHADHPPGQAPPAYSQFTANMNQILQRVSQIPNLSALLTAGSFYFSDTPTTRFPAHEPVHSKGGLRFQLQELEVALQGFVDPYLRADVFLALGLTGIEIEEAYFTTLGMPWNFQARGGYFYTQFGRFSTQHYLEVSPFVDMPLVNRRFFGGEQLRGLGGEVSWLAPLPWYLEVIVDITTANNEVSYGIPVDETAGIQDLLTVGHVKQYWDLSDALYLQWGLSAAQGGNNTGGPATTSANRTLLYGTDLYLKWRDLSRMRYLAIQAEYILRQAAVPGASTLEGGAYLHLDWRIHQNWQLAMRGDFFGLPSERNGELNFGGELRPFFTPSQQWRVGAALSYYLSEFHRWRLQYNYDHLLGDGGNLVAARDPVHEVFLQFQFILGSHGAHPF